MTKTCLVILYLLPCWWLPLQAQSEFRDNDTPAAPTQQKADFSSGNSLTVFGTATFANNGFYAKSSDRHLSLLGLQYGLLLARNRTLAFNYVPQAIPVAVLAQPSIHGFALQRSIPSITETEYVYGLGADPVAFEVDFQPVRKVQPLVSVQGGFLYFSRKVPSIAGAQFNFAADGRVGAKVRLSSERAISFGWLILVLIARADSRT